MTLVRFPTTLSSVHSSHCCWMQASQKHGNLRQKTSPEICFSVTWNIFMMNTLDTLQIYSNFELIPEIVFDASVLMFSFLRKTSIGLRFRKRLSFKSALEPGVHRYRFPNWTTLLLSLISWKSDEELSALNRYWFMAVFATANSPSILSCRKYYCIEFIIYQICIKRYKPYYACSAQWCEICWHWIHWPIQSDL